MRRKRPREVYAVCEGPTAPKWQSQDLRPNTAVLKAHCPVLPPKHETIHLSWSLESMTMSGGLKDHLVCLSLFTEKPTGVQRNDMACIEWAFRNGLPIPWLNADVAPCTGLSLCWHP